MSGEESANYESILISIKKQLNISPNDHAFDHDIILLINSAFATLHQLGVGPEEGFYITGPDEEWSEFVDDARLYSVKQFVWLNARVLFDPPNGSVLSSFESKINEYAWRLLVASEEIKAREGN